MKLFKDTKILRSILAVLILFIPLYPKFPLASVSSTYVAIRLDDIVVALALLVWFIYQLRHKFPVFKLPVTKLFIAYFSVITVVNIIAYLINQTDPISLLALHLFRRFEYMSLFFVAVSAIYSPKDYKYPFISLVVATIFACFYGYGQKYLSFPVVSTMNEEFSKGQLLAMSVWTRISSTFAGHYDFAAFLSIALVIIGAVAILTKKIYYKIPLLIVWIMSFQMLTYTASRVSIFAFWGGLSLTLFLLRKYLWIIPVTLIVAFSIVNSKDLNQRLLATIPALRDRLIAQNPVPSVIPTPTIIIPTSTVPTRLPTPSVKPLSPTPTVVRHEKPEEFPAPDVDAGVARSGEIRFNVEWPRAINALRKNPLIGTGLGSITLATDNDYLRSLGESGILGFLSFAAIFVWFVANTIKFIFKKDKTPSQTIAIILLGAMIVQFANALFIDVFEASKTAYLFWIMMGIYHQCLYFSKDESRQ